MTARTALLWLLVLTLALVGMTFAVNALHPGMAPRATPVRSVPPADDSPVLMAVAGTLPVPACHATMTSNHPSKPTEARGAWRPASHLRTCRFPGLRSSPS